jgi:hypothetical protein
VQLPHPDPDKAGETIAAEFKMQFEALPSDQAEALHTAADGDRHALLKRAVRGWDEDVVGDDEKPLAFSAEAFDRLMQVSWFRIGVYRAWGESLVPGAAKRGN